MDRGIRNPLLQVMVHGHVVLALGAALQVWWIGAEWYGEGSWPNAAAAFFATAACYGYNRLMRARDESLRRVPLFAWYREHRPWMTALVATGIIIALALRLRDLPQLLQRLWPVLLPALLYVTPIRTKAGTVLGLRQVPGLKSLLVAWVWAAGTVLLAADEAGGLAWMLVTVLLCFYWSIAIAFDVRDAPVDAKGLRTVPQLFGSRVAKSIAVLLLLPLGWALVFQYLLNMAGDRHAAELLPLLGLAASGALVLRSTPDRRWHHWLLLDACIALVPLCAILSGMR